MKLVSFLAEAATLRIRSGVHSTITEPNERMVVLSSCDGSAMKLRLYDLRVSLR